MRSHDSVNNKMRDGKSSWQVASSQTKIDEVSESVMHANAIKCFESEHRIVSHNHDSST